MKRFFRSAAFPILIVLVLAFFASRVINQGEPEDIPTFNEEETQAIMRDNVLDLMTPRPA